MSVASVEVAGRRFAGASAPPPKAPVLAPIATAFLKGYKAYRSAQLAREDVAASQERQVLRLVAKARDTQFGRDHDFAGIKQRRRLPGARAIAHLQPALGRLLVEGLSRPRRLHLAGQAAVLCRRSGTSTGKSSTSPAPRRWCARTRRAALDILVHHMRHRPDCRMYDGQFFMLGGSTNLVEQAPGVYSAISAASPAIAALVGGLPVSTARDPLPHRLGGEDLAHGAALLAALDPRRLRLPPLAARAVREARLVARRRAGPARRHLSRSRAGRAWRRQHGALQEALRRAAGRQQGAAGGGLCGERGLRRGRRPWPRRGHTARDRYRHLLRVRAGGRARQRQPDAALDRYGRDRSRLRHRA